MRSGGAKMHAEATRDGAALCRDRLSFDRLYYARLELKNRLQPAADGAMARTCATQKAPWIRTRRRRNTNSNPETTRHAAVEHAEQSGANRCDRKSDTLPAVRTTEPETAQTTTDTKIVDESGAMAVASLPSGCEKRTLDIRAPAGLHTWQTKPVLD